MLKSQLLYILEYPIPYWLKEEIDEVKNTYENFFYTTVGKFFKKPPDNNYIRPHFYHFLITILRILLEPVRYLPTIRKYRSEIGITIIIQAISIRELIKKFQRVKIHCHFASASTTAGLILFELYNYPFSFTAHAWDIYSNTINKSLLTKKIKLAYYVRTISNYNKNYLAQISPEAQIKIRVIHCGINPKNFSVNDKPLNRELIKIISASNLVEKKGYFNFITSLKQIKRSEINFHWVIAGDGPLKTSLIHFIRENRLDLYIELIPPIPHNNLQNFFDSGDIFFLPCTISSNGDRDGIPVILMEAMAAGVIVISTKISGIPELIINNFNGFLLENNCATEFIDLIKYILTLSNEDINEIRKNARITIEKNFNIQSIVRAHLHYI